MALGSSFRRTIVPPISGTEWRITDPLQGRGGGSRFGTESPISERQGGFRAPRVGSGNPRKDPPPRALSPGSVMRPVPACPEKYQGSWEIDRSHTHRRRIDLRYHAQEREKPLRRPIDKQFVISFSSCHLGASRHRGGFSFVASGHFLSVHGRVRYGTVTSVISVSIRIFAVSEWFSVLPG